MNRHARRKLVATQAPGAKATTVRLQGGKYVASKGSKTVVLKWEDTKEPLQPGELEAGTMIKFDGNGLVKR